MKRTLKEENNYKDSSGEDGKCENTPSSPKSDAEAIVMMNNAIECICITIENQQRILESQKLIIEELRLNIK